MKFWKIVSVILLAVIIISSGYIVFNNKIDNFISSFYPQQINYKEDGKIVYIDKDILDILNNEYLNDDEYFYYIQGYEYKDRYEIVHLIKPKILNSSKTSIRVDSLPEFYDNDRLIGDIHSHPDREKYKYGNMLCFPSYQDIYTWGVSWAGLGIIQCGENTFAIYEFDMSTFSLKSLKWEAKDL